MMKRIINFINLRLERNRFLMRNPEAFVRDFPLFAFAEFKGNQTNNWEIIDSIMPIFYSFSPGETEFPKGVQ